MCAASFNPKKCEALDALKKPEVSMLAVSSITAYLGRVDPIEQSHEWSRRLEKLGPRADRTQLIKEYMEHLRTEAVEAFGTTQIPVMVTFGPDVYAAFVPDLMSSDDLFAFKNTWRIRGIRPTPILAYKMDGWWNYKRIEDARRP